MIDRLHLSRRQADHPGNREERLLGEFVSIDLVRRQVDEDGAGRNCYGLLVVAPLTSFSAGVGSLALPAATRVSSFTVRRRPHVARKRVCRRQLWLLSFVCQSHRPRPILVGYSTQSPSGGNRLHRPPTPSLKRLT